jgi:hypothetical protein
MNLTQLTFAAAANWSGLNVTVTLTAGRVYRFRCVVPQMVGINGVSMMVQMVRGTSAFGSQFGGHAFITGALRQFGPAIELSVYGSEWPGQAVYGMRGWNSAAGTTVLCENGQAIILTIEDIGQEL